MSIPPSSCLDLRPIPTEPAYRLQKISQDAREGALSLELIDP